MPTNPMDEMDAPTESDSERDGFLSYAGEWHALAVGLGVGMWAAFTGQPVLIALIAGVAIIGKGGERLGKRLGGRFAAGELKREPWYSFGGALIGYALGFLLGLSTSF